MGAQFSPTTLHGRALTARERMCLPMVCADSARVDTTAPLFASTHTSHEFCHGSPATATISPKRLDPSERVTKTVSPTASWDTGEGQRQSSARLKAGLGAAAAVRSKESLWRMVQCQEPRTLRCQCRRGRRAALALTRQSGHTRTESGEAGTAPWR